MIKKKYYKIIIFNLLILALLILFVEVFFRIITNNGEKLFLGKRLYNYKVFEKYVPNYYQSDDDLIFTLRPFKKNLISMQNYSKYSVHIIDYNGINIRKGGLLDNKKSKIKKILMIGDSYTFGVYLDEDETISSKLKSMFKSSNHLFSVINAGYSSGFDPDQHHVFLNKHISKIKPDFVIYGFFIGNDLIKIDKDKRWQIIDNEGLPLSLADQNLKVVNGYIKQKDDNADNILGSKLQSLPLLRHSFFYVTFMRLIENKIKPYLLSFEKTHWSKNPFPEILNESYDLNQQDQDLKKLILGMKKISNKNNAEFIVLNQPINFEIYERFIPINVDKDKDFFKRNYFGSLIEFFDNHNIQYIDPRASLKKSKYLTYPENGEVHYNKYGAEVVAEDIYKFFLEKFIN